MIAISPIAVTQYQSQNSDVLSDIGWVFEKFGIVGLAVPVSLYWYDQRRLRSLHEKEEEDRMRKACDAILTEINGNKQIFTTQDYYPHTTKNDKIDFIYADFGSQSYESLLHSGFYPSFSVETQSSLSSLYSRIKVYNELVKYLAHYTDLININNMSELYDELVESYDIALTKMLDEIENIFRFHISVNQ